MQRIDFINTHAAKVKFIYDFLNHKHASILCIKGISREGKKEATTQAVNLCKKGEDIQDIGSTENSWSFININTAHVKIIQHIYSWDEVPKDSNVVCIAFDRDPSYSNV